jgi:NAD(P)-dependent dehydrogenase (short-subunit alcohol dehydrogenase family)
MEEKVAIVTGASSGIGKATAAVFAEAGAQVVAVGRSENELGSLRDECRETNGAIRIHLADITESSQVDRLVSETIQHLGQIDILVNAAGILKPGSITDTSLDDWDKMMNINVRSVFSLMQKCEPHLENTKGNIVNVSSVTGSRAFPGVVAYCVSKAAIDHLTRCAALELAPKGIRVNAVNPGVVVTNLHRRGGMAEEDYHTFLENAKNTHPIGRVGEAREVADLIYFLASDKAGWITGATYAIDGGRGQTCAR